MRAIRLAGAVALVAVAFGGAASAVSLNPQGFGQALVYPYYTVNRGQATLISVVNASDAGKAIEIRVREGYNGRGVLEFVALLGAHDVWTMSLSQPADEGAAILRTTDTSCTLPSIPAAGEALRTRAYDGTGIAPLDGGPTGSARTREGFVEIFAAGDVVPGSATDHAITHVAGAVPPCGTLPQAWESDLVAPSNTLFGSGAIVDVAQGTFYPYNADAIAGFTSFKLSPTKSTLPDPDVGITFDDAITDGAISGVATAYLDDATGRPHAIDYTTGVGAVSAVFMADAIYNEYLVATTLAAHTDWIVTFPTKQFYVDGAYGFVPQRPFEREFETPGHAPVEVSGVSYDREESALAFDENCTFCPSIEAPLALGYQVNVLPVGTDTAMPPSSPVLGSVLTSFEIPASGSAGNIMLRFDANGDHVLTFGVEPGFVPIDLVGLPVTGFMAYNVINANAQPGMLANYSGLFRHRSTMGCLGDADNCVAFPSGNGE